MEGKLCVSGRVHAWAWARSSATPHVGQLAPHLHLADPIIHPCVATSPPRHPQLNHPCILEHLDDFKLAIEGKRLAVFLDYDGKWLARHAPFPKSSVLRVFLGGGRATAGQGATRPMPVAGLRCAGTLTPIVPNPDDAVMSEEVGGGCAGTWPLHCTAVSRTPLGAPCPRGFQLVPLCASACGLQMRKVVKAVARLFPTAIISGRGREKVEGFVQLRELFYAGSHGMDIAGPKVRLCGVDGCVL